MPNSVNSSDSVILPPPAPPEKAPFFGTWRRAYVAVIVAFVVQVALLWTLTRVFS